MIVRELLTKLGFQYDPSAAIKADKQADKVKVGMAAASGAVLALGAALGAAATAFVAMAVKTSTAAEKFNDMSARTGVSTDALQELSHAANLSGTNIDEVAFGLTNLGKSAIEAQKKGGETAAAFARLGVALKDENGKLRTSDELMMDVADGLSQMPDGAEKTALAFDLMGRAGKALIPLLNKGGSLQEGKETIASLREEAYAFGVVMDESALASGSRFANAITRAKSALEGIRNTLAGPLLDDLSSLVEGFLEWWKANRLIAQQRMREVLVVVKLGVQAVALAFRALWKVLDFVIVNFKLLAIVLTGVGLAALYANAAAAAAATGWYIALGIAAMRAALQAAASWVVATGPIVLLAAAISFVLLLLEDMYTFLVGGDSLIGDWGMKWKKLIDDFTKPAEGDHWITLLFKQLIADVFDIQGAFERMIAAGPKAFGMAVEWISEKVQALSEAIRKVVELATAGVKVLVQFSSIPTALDMVTGGGQWLDRNLGALVGNAPAESFGGGSSPAASVQTSAGGGSSGRFVQNNLGGNTINVTAAPGMDEAAVGDVVQKKVEEVFSVKLREAEPAT